MEIKETYSFQVDSEIVKKYYHDHDNFLIEYSDEVPKEYCAIYFTSHNLYYPNNESAFLEQFVKKNRYEWYKTRINYAQKHIFIRDIQKQWYLGGINSRLNSPEKLASFLKDEIEGYKVVTVGSSAGGFAAVLFGQLLNANHILTFNGNFELASKLKTTTEVIAPYLFRNIGNHEIEKLYDSRNFISKPSSIFYFHSTHSPKDIIQYSHVKDLPIKCIKFRTSNHGVPFLKTNLPYVINCQPTVFDQMDKNIFSPVLFSLQKVGFVGTLSALTPIINFGITKIKRKLKIRR